jgi:hypothetical protein
MQWETCCVTSADWEALHKELKASRSRYDKELVSYMDEIIDKIVTRLQVCNVSMADAKPLAGILFLAFARLADTRYHCIAKGQKRSPPSQFGRISV